MKFLQQYDTKRNHIETYKTLRGLLRTKRSGVRIPSAVPKCVDEKDARKQSALLCGFFAPKQWFISKNQKIINGFTKTGSVISKLRFGDANSGKIYTF